MPIKNFAAFLLCSFGVIALNGCGGGGGGGGSNNSGSSSAVSNPDFEVTFLPSSLSANVLETESTIWTVQVSVNAKRQVDGNVYTVIEDKKGNIDPQVYIEQQSTTRYKVTLRSSKTLAAGTYLDTLKLHLCADANCTKEYRGSPWSLPYSISVKSHWNPVALSPIPDYHGWVSRFGGKTNTGFVPITLDPAQFSYRWYKRLSKGKTVSELVTEDDKIFYNESDTQNSNFSVVALDERDGGTLWTSTFDQAVAGDSAFSGGYGLNVASGLVSLVYYTATYGDAHIILLNSSSGEIAVDHKSLDYSYGGSGALLDGDYLYKYGSFQDHYGLGQLSRDDVTLNWMSEGKISYNYINRWLPTIDNENIYIYGQFICNLVEFCGDGAGLSVLDKQTGTKVAFVPDPKSPVVESGEIMPPIITEQGILALSGRRDSISSYFEPSLSLYDVRAKSIKWSVNDAFLYQPVVANGVVYTIVSVSMADPAVKELKLVVRDLASGNVLWTLPIVNPRGIITDINDGMIITNNILFVATANQVAAVDINTHKIVWEYPFGGRIAMTRSGVLVVNRYLDRIYYNIDTAIISAVTLK